MPCLLDHFAADLLVDLSAIVRLLESSQFASQNRGWLIGMWDMAEADRIGPLPLSVTFSEEGSSRDVP